MTVANIEIRTLDPCDDVEGRRMHEIFQRAYKVEAQIIGIKHFPPLQRTMDDRASSQSDFIGAWIEQQLAGVAELRCGRDELHIDALVVDPIFFRRGVASQLLTHILSQNRWSTAMVETATANQPALSLYDQHGFVTGHRWTTDTGIKKVRLFRHALVTDSTS